MLVRNTITVIAIACEVVAQVLRSSILSEIVKERVSEMLIVRANMKRQVSEMVIFVSKCDDTVKWK